MLSPWANQVFILLIFLAFLYSFVYSNSVLGNDSDDWDDGEDENDIAWSSPRLMPEDGARLVEHALSHFENRVNDLQHYQDTLKRKADDLQRSINELDACNLSPDQIEKICNIMDKATVYKVASLAMVNVSAAIYSNKDKTATVASNLAIMCLCILSL